jgi:hypothetical protein
MKVGILTFHDGINHGGFFQVFSSYQYLKGLGYDVEVINYKNKTHFWRELVTLFMRKNPMISFNNFIKKRKFNKALEMMQMTNFSTNIKKIDINVYDVIVVGSDIVWNFDWAFLGKDPIYFGAGLENCNLVSYAPSCGAANIETSNIPSFVSGIKSFKSISVRDKKTADLVRVVTNETPKIVIDPAFLIDHQEYQTIISENKDYLLVYAFRLKTEEIAQITKFAKSNNLVTISVGYSNSWCDKNYVSVGPFEWLTYFNKAKYVVSGTFHGTLFAIKNEKQFAICGNEGINSKLKTILKETELENKFVDDSNLSQILNDEIDYKKVNSKLEPFISTSKNYLKNAIEIN